MSRVVYLGGLATHLYNISAPSIVFFCLARFLFFCFQDHNFFFFFLSFRGGFGVGLIDWCLRFFVWYFLFITDKYFEF